MITIFNRRELLATFSMREQAAVRDKLSAGGIDYKVKVINRGSPSPLGGTRERSGSFGENPDLAYEYVFYVKKSDFEQAVGLLK